MWRWIVAAALAVAACEDGDDGSLIGRMPVDTALPVTDCCKVCTDSQACGDSCISWDDECSADPGCACQE